ncbi:AraC family transcriptional regulator [Herbaspirillum sp. LeCh32-8]|uniref:AraC family transcriptional regulator n=1 Tax=Herbaspirillum sp. LeCh32-8 TaxID=2821356 RepID=UPI001AE2BC57|nr:AraC family transcriptional regulator [Herbaspirillum sp. LeCh32-8]MBP0597392.1 AraC family transcriptional regulator [Herbaspirillum sp. LeCh32-8]
MLDAIDPLAEFVTLLRPAARYSKAVSGAGPWRVRRTDPGQSFYSAVLEGACRVLLDDGSEVVLQAGDFVLAPSMQGFAMASLEASDAPDITDDNPPPQLANGEFRLGRLDAEPQARFLVGHCMFDSPDSALLVSLLPQLVIVRGQERLATLVRLVSEESRAQRPAREVVLARLLEVLLIEALRSGSESSAGASPGLLRGLADARLALAIRRMHERPSEPWSVAQLAREAALSRSAFFERFRREVGVAPMEYLLAWRMALAKGLLLQGAGGVAEIAQQVGYSSASTFSVAFGRHVGMPPSRYVQEQRQARPA